ncbi:hypothetical protein AGMMS50262_20410 [Bacteroidia bacterium]|nr:hypothetical protein AGMMS50262_20410 [Bacteroidia bacterium]
MKNQVLSVLDSVDQEIQADTTHTDAEKKELLFFSFLVRYFFSSDVSIQGFCSLDAPADTFFQFLQNYFSKGLTKLESSAVQIQDINGFKEQALGIVQSIDQEENPQANHDQQNEVQPTPEGTGQPTTEVTDTVRDYRIKELTVSDFRKIPPKANGKPFGLKLYNNAKSLILIGGNSTGKSSLFGSLEFVLTNSISEAKLRETTDFFAGVPDIKVTTHNGHSFQNFVQFDNELKHLDISPCFCSEQDIIHIGKRGVDDWNDFFLENLGLKPLYNLKQCLGKKKGEWNNIEAQKRELLAREEQLKGETRELISQIQTEGVLKIDHKLIDVMTIELEYLRLITQDTNWHNKSSDEKIKELKERMCNIISQIEAQTDSHLHTNLVQWLKDQYMAYPKTKSILSPDDEDSIINNIIQLYQKELKKSLKSIEDVFLDKQQPLMEAHCEKYHEFCKDNEKLPTIDVRLNTPLVRYLDYLEKALNQEVLSRFNSIRPTIQSALKLFMDDTEKLLITPEESTESTENTKITIKIKVDGVERYPKNYYNTFRYKLFCMMLKISTAFALMEKHRINLPIVLDDVFYASDYHNKSQITDFINALLESYKTIFPQENLQLICFTHDELVLEAIQKSDIAQDNCIFGRLLEPESIITAANVLGAETTINKYFHLSDMFNLYVELFKNE